jgi:hypothetical protein
VITVFANTTQRDQEPKHGSAPVGRNDDRDFDPYRMVDPYEKRSKRRASRQAGGAHVDAAQTDDWLIQNERHRHRLMATFILVSVLLAGSFGGFVLYDSFRAPDISAYAQTGITVSGLEEGDFVVTPEELLTLKLVKTSATGSGKGPNGESKAGTAHAYGPSIETFLQAHGHTLSDFRRIVFLCKDGYSVVLKPDELKGDVILSVASGNDPLAAYQEPLRIILPEGATHQWTFGILRIEFTLQDKKASSERRTDRDSTSSGDEILTPQVEGKGDEPDAAQEDE